MAISFPNFPESPLNFQKFIKNPKNLKSRKMNTNLKSFWAFLSSIFLYISIFYVFNLSPSALFCSTMFWFFISNTLVLIIAADFIAFSSSKDHDYYDEYVSSKSTSLPSSDDRVVAKTTVSSDMNEDEIPHEKIITMVDQTREYYEHEILSIKRKEDDDDDLEKTGEEKLRARCVRSNYDKVMMMATVAEEREKKLALNRTLSERHDDVEEPRLEENEFSRMSVEELNRRVEEFIRRFNRQIRLQAVRIN